MIGLNEGFFHSRPSPADERVMPQQVAEWVTGIFRDHGWLQTRMGLDHRPQQEVMAERALAAWQADAALFFEAGTGVGKSLAYLLPGIMQAVTTGRQLLVSTHTIALQEQIKGKDLELCRSLFASVPELADFARFQTVLMLGRGNYLCGARLKHALESKTELFHNALQADLLRIAKWSQTTETGLIQDLLPAPMPEVWEWVQSDGHTCNPRNCNPKTCFYRKAREAIRNAQVVVLNHSLLFSLLTAGLFPRGETRGILFPNDFLVLDEAHTLPQIATDYFGLQLSEVGLRRLLLKLFNAQRGKPRGLLAKEGTPALRNAVGILLLKVEQFFDGLREKFLNQNRPFRLREANWSDNPLDTPLKELMHGIALVTARMEEGTGRDELEGARKLLQAYQEGLVEIIALSAPETVYWLESGKAQHVILRSAPLDVAGPLRERLFDRKTGLLLTSATLAEGPSMDSFKRKVGGSDAAHGIVTSPFDYDLQMQVIIHKGAPDPARHSGRINTEFLTGQILHFSRDVAGGTLVLFTSYRDLQEVYAGLEADWAALNRPLLAQGSGVPRSHLVKAMKSAGNALLLGTDSFWTGVDIQGPALSQVILTRLPFENPSHPVAEARADFCRANQLSAFNELTLPAALVKFRQGIGRLIRSHADEGRLVILDSRILHKNYGRLFLDVLPNPRYRVVG